MINTMIDNRITKLQSILDEFEHECFMLRVEASETRAKDDVVRESYERIRDEFARHIVTTLESELELIDLAHNAWSMALCAMQGMPIPAEWGNTVERGLRKHGINVDEELTGFEVDDDDQ